MGESGRAAPRLGASGRDARAVRERDAGAREDATEQCGRRAVDRQRDQELVERAPALVDFPEDPARDAAHLGGFRRIGLQLAGDGPGVRQRRLLEQALAERDGRYGGGVHERDRAAGARPVDERQRGELSGSPGPRHEQRDRSRGRGRVDELPLPRRQIVETEEDLRRAGRARSELLGGELLLAASIPEPLPGERALQLAQQLEELASQRVRRRRPGPGERIGGPSAATKIAERSADRAVEPGRAGDRGQWPRPSAPPPAVLQDPGDQSRHARLRELATFAEADLGGDQIAHPFAERDDPDPERAAGSRGEIPARRLPREISRRDHGDGAKGIVGAVSEDLVGQERAKRGEVGSGEGPHCPLAGGLGTDSIAVSSRSSAASVAASG